MVCYQLWFFEGTYQHTHIGQSLRSRESMYPLTVDSIHIFARLQYSFVIRSAGSSSCCYNYVNPVHTISGGQSGKLLIPLFQFGLIHAMHQQINHFTCMVIITITFKTHNKISRFAVKILWNSMLGK
jgi:hypothetical protein